MIFDLAIFSTYILLLFISVLGYGLIFNKYINTHYLNSNKLNIGEIGFFALLILIPISIITNFFFKINYLFVSIIFIVGFILFFWQIKFKKNFVKILFSILFLFILMPYFYLSSHHDDFYYYHLPYLNILQNSKIIFGLVNLNTVLAYPQNLWFNVFSLFRLPIIDFNGLQALNGIFTLFFIIFCYENFLNTKLIKLKIINLIFLIFIFVLFSRLKDHGAEIIPQLLMLVCSYYIFELLFDKSINKNKYITKIILIFTCAILLRLSSIILLPLIFYIFLINFNNLLNFFKNIKFVLIVIMLVSLVLIKNFINSGCIVYPLSSTCFKQGQVSWSIDKDIPKINENVILSYTRGWMIYAKENTNGSSKFVFNPTNELLTHKEYLDNGAKFWLKYWFKDPDITRITNMFLVGLFILICLFLANLKNLNFKYQNLIHQKTNFAILFIIFSILFWLFFSTPSTRYGGYAIFISLIALLISHISNSIFSNNFNIYKAHYFVITLSLIFFYTKNLQRINSDNVNIPWPKEELLIKNVDYRSTIFDGERINLRLPTNKLIMGNLNEKNNYILHCGNIEPLCTPNKKLGCMKKIYKKFNYRFIINDNQYCINLHNQHALY